MDTYYDEYSTPLKYHKFLKYFSLPLSCLIALAQVTIITNYYWDINDFYKIDVVYYLILLAVCGVTIYGFYTWNPCGYYGIISMEVLSIAYSVLTLFVAVFFAPENIASQLGSAIGTSIVSVLVIIYYRKRRPLFFWHLREACIQELFSRPDISPVVPTLSNKSYGDPNRCRVCGETLNPSRMKCMRCGTVAHAAHIAPTVPSASVSPIPEDPQPQADTLSPCFCHKCGSKLIEDSRFCSRCGTEVVR